MRVTQSSEIVCVQCGQFLGATVEDEDGDERARLLAEEHCSATHATETWPQPTYYRLA